MKRNIVLSSSAGYTFDQLRYWIHSLDRCGFTGERIVVVANADPPLIARLEESGCTVVCRERLLTPGRHRDEAFANHDMSVERFFLYWKILQERREEDTGFVIAVDIRDAIFQQDPGTWLATHLGSRKLVVASEGLTYHDQPWNRDSMRDAFGDDVLGWMGQRLVWNCGTLAGEFAAFRDLALNIFTGCAARNVPYSDQASLNLLLSLEPYRSLVLFDDGTLGWACQAGTMAAEARGPELSYRFRGVEPLFDGDAVYTRDGTPFCIVHQYDRVPHWKQAIEKRFG
jgi:hypothetical protein